MVVGSVWTSVAVWNRTVVWNKKVVWTKTVAWNKTIARNKGLRMPKSRAQQGFTHAEKQQNLKIYENCFF